MRDIGADESTIRHAVGMLSFCYPLNCTQAGMMWVLHANTMPALFWLLFYILRDKAALSAIQQEIFDIATRTEHKLPSNVPLFGADELKDMKVTCFPTDTEY